MTNNLLLKYNDFYNYIRIDNKNKNYYVDSNLRRKGFDENYVDKVYEIAANNRTNVNLHLTIITTGTGSYSHVSYKENNITYHYGFKQNMNDGYFIKNQYWTTPSNNFINNKIKRLLYNTYNIIPSDNENSYKNSNRSLLFLKNTLFDLGIIDNLRKRSRSNSSKRRRRRTRSRSITRSRSKSRNRRIMGSFKKQRKTRSTSSSTRRARR